MSETTTMNESNPPDGVPDGHWPAATDSLNRVVQGAHDAVDRFADSAAPKVRQLGQSVSSAETAVRARVDQLGRTRDEWAESLRGRVRSNPLTAIAAAMALGAVIARITR
jgi:hypothetical protein